MRYEDLNDELLRQLCVNFELETAGSRSELIARLREYERLQERLRELRGQDKAQAEREETVDRGASSEANKGSEQEPGQEPEPGREPEQAGPSKAQPRFRLGVLIAAGLFGYVAYFVYQVHGLFTAATDYLYGDSWIAQLIVSAIESSGEEAAFDAINFIKGWLGVVLVSYIAKTLLALKHLVNPSKWDLSFIAVCAIFIDWIPFFLKSWSAGSFEEAMETILIIVPAAIGLALMFSKEYWGEGA